MLSRSDKISNLGCASEIRCHVRTRSRAVVASFATHFTSPPGRDSLPIVYEVPDQLAHRNSAPIHRRGLQVVSTPQCPVLDEHRRLPLISSTRIEADRPPLHPHLARSGRATEQPPRSASSDQSLRAALQTAVSSAVGPPYAIFRSPPFITFIGVLSSMRGSALNR